MKFTCSHCGHPIEIELTVEMVGGGGGDGGPTLPLDGTRDGVGVWQGGKWQPDPPSQADGEVKS